MVEEKVGKKIISESSESLSTCLSSQWSKYSSFHFEWVLNVNKYLSKMQQEVFSFTLDKSPRITEKWPLTKKKPLLKKYDDH